MRTPPSIHLPRLPLRRLCEANFHA
jgi:hypothetical protein